MADHPQCASKLIVIFSVRPLRIHENIRCRLAIAENAARLFARLQSNGSVVILQDGSNRLMSLQLSF
jgi:hypothetical protein